MEHDQQTARKITLERLEQQRHSLVRHMRDLEAQLKDVGNHLISVDEHITRLRGSIEKIYTKD